jgi:predicted DNA-binding ribbon-helix-helix protein
MISLVIKRSIIIDGQKTSVSLENEFWDGLREIASRKNVALSTLVKQIDTGRTTNNLYLRSVYSSSITFMGS